MTPTDATQALFPCPNPWCHSHTRDLPLTSIGIMEVPIPHGRMGFKSRCNDCGVFSPVAEKKAEAIAAWNTRSQSHSLPGDVGMREAWSELWGIVHGCDLRLSVPMETVRKVRAALTPSPCPGDGMRALLVEARDLFRFYEESHRAKVAKFEGQLETATNDTMRDHISRDIADTLEKAGRNKAMADKIAAVLTLSALSGDAGDGEQHYSVAMERRPKEVCGVKVGPGLYRIHWKSGGSSLAAIGMCRNGAWWVAPTNWVEPAVPLRVDEDPEGRWSWHGIEALERIEPASHRGAGK